MTEPRRWRNDDAPEEIRRMLTAARPTGGMPSAAAARVSRRLGVAVASGAGFFGLLSWKALALAATLSATSVGAVLVVRQLAMPAPVERAASVQPARARKTAVVSTPPETAAPPVEATPEVVAAPMVPQRAVVRARSEPAARKPDRSSEDTLASEIALLGRARAELDQHPRQALRDVDEHARTFADGKLVLERELLALDILERLGRHAQAQARGQRLLQRAQGTIYEERVRARILSH